MIRTEIDITNPQKVEVIETGEIGYIILRNKSGVSFVSTRNGSILGWYDSEELRPFEDRLVFDVEMELSAINFFFNIIDLDFDYQDLKSIEDTHTFQVIAIPNEKSLEDMTKEEHIEMVKQLRK